MISISDNKKSLLTFCHETVANNFNIIYKKNVLEICYTEKNDFIKSLCLSMLPNSYTRMSEFKQMGVDLVCPMNEIIKRFSVEKSDLTICINSIRARSTWQEDVFNVKAITKIGGYLVLQTSTMTPSAALEIFERDFKIHNLDELENDKIYIFAEKIAESVFDDFRHIVS